MSEHVKMHCTDEEPRPESGDGRRIQAEQMPPFGKVVEAVCTKSPERKCLRGWNHLFWLLEIRLFSPAGA